MNQIVISLPRFTSLGLFEHILSPYQAEAVAGGSIYFSVMNVSDGINTVENTYRGDYSWNFHDNKIHTIDYSRSNYNWFYIL
ncbi:hypothetical protein [Anabaena azotica]|uniref:Uncharacterized protein n=1 Tax=Anabaena azotica FACHB-119 TaxID=947527 RepID=A0ABR8CWC6_9NOST|nr:hypothetical protein [Anabaena azotica]MBD2499244.1 hypothetical protein [Anabaena azotica FACHB-119]